MAGTFTIKITKTSGQITSVPYAHLWRAWLNGKLLGNGYCFKPEQGIARAHGLVCPDEVEHIEIIEA